MTIRINCQLTLANSQGILRILELARYPIRIGY